MKINKALILSLCFIILLSSNSLAVGIMGYKTIIDIDFTPDYVGVFQFFVRTNVGVETQDYELYVRSGGGEDLSQYVSLEPDILKDIPGGQTLIPFKAILKLPEKIETPGIHQIRVGVVETKVRGGGLVSGGAGIGVRTGSEAIINVRVLFPEKTIVTKVKAEDVGLGEISHIDIIVENWGEPDLQKVNAKVDIIDPKGNIRDTVFTNSVSIPSAQSKTLKTEVSTDGFEPGVYTAFATIYYDGEKTNDEDDFRVGIMNVKIINYTREFEKDKISPFNIIIESEWNRPINSLYGEVNINRSRFLTPSLNLKAWERTVITGYWDTNGYQLGLQKANVTLYYENSTTIDIGNVTIIEKIVEKPSIFKSTTTLILISLLILLLIINIILLTRRRGKKKK